MSLLQSLPTDLLRFTANSFLGDRTAASLGQCSHQFFADLHSSYLIKTQLKCLIFSSSAELESILPWITIGKKMPQLLIQDRERGEEGENSFSASSSLSSFSLNDEPIVQARKKQKREVSSSQVTVEHSHLPLHQPARVIRLKWYTKDCGDTWLAARYAIGQKSNVFLENSIIQQNKPAIDLTSSNIEWNSFLPVSHLGELELGNGFQHDGGLGANHKIITSLPSLSQFTRLHTLKFVCLSQFTAPIRENQWFWPSTLTTLEYRWLYMSKVIDSNEIVFPPSLTRLVLPQRGNAVGPHPFFDPSALTFPMALKSLVLPDIDKVIVDWKPPSHLESLVCHVHYAQEVTKMKWPTHLLSLEINMSSLYAEPAMKSLASICLPQALHTLSLLHYVHKVEVPLNDVVFPASLTKLVLGQEYYHPISLLRLPLHLQHLETSAISLRPYSNSLARFMQLIHLTLNGQKCDKAMSRKLCLPATLETLEFGHPLDKLSLAGLQLPPRLKSLLIYSRTFMHSLSSILFPPSLRRLEMGCRHKLSSCFNHPLDISATQVDVLVLGECWNLPLSQLQLPPTLRELYFAGLFNQSFADFTLPPHLEVLAIEQTALGTLMFRQVESLAQVELPRSLIKLVLPHPHRMTRDGWVSDGDKAAYPIFLASLRADSILVHEV